MDLFDSESLRMGSLPNVTLTLTQWLTPCRVDDLQICQSSLAGLLILFMLPSPKSSPFISEFAYMVLLSDHWARQ